jgi:lipopolysaccharide biosynthesis glycosyltransferase
MTTEHVNVAVHFDRSYAVHATTMVRSLLDNAAPHCHVDLYVLGVDLTPEIKAKATASWPAERLTVHWTAVNLAPFQSLLDGSGYPSVAYSRILLDWLLPERVARVISLDSDGLVLGDIADLWRQAPVHGCASAVVDLTVLRVGNDPSPFIRLADHCVHAPYFNSGVMVVDLDRWRHLGITRQCLELARRFPAQAVYADQSLLNAVLRDEWEALPLRWNCNAFWIAESSYPTFQGRSATMTEVGEASRDPGFVHFVGRRKPWNTEDFHPHAELYRDYQSRTQWAPPVASPPARWQRNRYLFRRAMFPIERYRRVRTQAKVQRLRRRRTADVVHLAVTMLPRRNAWRAWGESST